MILHVQNSMEWKTNPFILTDFIFNVSVLVRWQCLLHPTTILSIVSCWLSKSFPKGNIYKYLMIALLVLRTQRNVYRRGQLTSNVTAFLSGMFRTNITAGQKLFMVGSVIHVGHRWCQNVEKTKKWHTSRYTTVSLMFWPHFDISDLLLNRCTAT